MNPRSTVRLAWAALGWILLVVLWGAFVRATGSGAGCGEHWPLCNGQVLPRSASLQTVIEFSHRITSGLALILVVALAVSAFRNFPEGHAARRGSVWSVVFILTEALVGAALVLLGLVGVDASTARAWVMVLHLLNTFVLLGWLALTAAWASGMPASPGLGGLMRRRGWLAAALLAMLLSGSTGAIAALGDTLFPATSFAHGLQQDFSGSSHILLKLRVWHPVAACLAATVIWLSTSAATAGASTTPDAQRTRTLGSWLAGLVLLQVTFGFLNAALLAPNWMQLVHLGLADSIWVLLVLFASSQARLST